MTFKKITAWLLSAFRGVCGLALSEFRGSLKKSRSHTHKYATLDFFGATHEIHLKSCALSALIQNALCATIHKFKQTLLFVLLRDFAKQNRGNPQKFSKLQSKIIISNSTFGFLAYLLPCPLSLKTRFMRVIARFRKANPTPNSACRVR